MQKIYVYPTNDIITPFKRKKKYITWTKETRLVVVKCTNNYVRVKPAGRGNHRDLEFMPFLLDVKTVTGRRVNLMSATTPLWLISSAHGV